MAQLDKYKQAVIEEYQRSNKNIFVNATAGSGKTTVLCEIAKRTPPTKELIFLAFNKSIAQELQNRLPKTAKASTLHSCALSMLRKTFNPKFAISDSKNFNLAKNNIDFKGTHPKRIPGVIMNMCRLYDLMRLNLIEDSVRQIITLGERYGLDVDEKLVMRAIELKNLNLTAATRYFQNGCCGTLQIDFTDMLYYAHKFVPEAKIQRYNVVLCDETQDLNPLQYEIIKKLKTPRGRIVAVGDDKQTIYSFQGSSLDVLNTIKNAPNTISLPLSMTYRCAQKIVEEANKVFPNEIFAAPDAPEGSVCKGHVEDAQAGDYVVCRNNAPLVDAFLSLLKQGKKCQILGKELGDDLASLIDSVDDIYELEDQLNELYNLLKKKGYKNPENTETYDKLDERVSILLSLYEYFGSLEKVKSVIYDIFVENPGSGITLSTIHKAKGLEAERVYFLRPDLIPSKFAATELEMYAEQCLRFVAITRAKKMLIYC